MHTRQFTTWKAAPACWPPFCLNSAQDSGQNQIANDGACSQAGWVALRVGREGCLPRQERGIVPVLTIGSTRCRRYSNAAARQVPFHRAIYSSLPSSEPGFPAAMFELRVWHVQVAGIALLAVLASVVEKKAAMVSSAARKRRSSVCCDIFRPP